MTQENGSSGKHGVYAMKTGASASNNETSICGGKGGSSGSGANSPEYLKEFIEKTLKDGKNWPTSTEGADTTRKSTTNDNADAVAKDLVALNSDEKTIVAGLLAKTIAGGEVVEIRVVSSTFVSI
ncbi:putative p44-77 outer membrane protein, silent [Anaplasma phagocytophilum str. ApNP]|uniref:Putative p44-77 outer membrane protein, silent n=2 Tax=Anaplasma phagocytophilum TaxID=948 RepID=A0A0F3NIE6_ANAPH|nr:putative p44-77 outer membrane protein, silent [Anaplasma phagocytophilum str. ApNP]